MDILQRKLANNKYQPSYIYGGLLLGKLTAENQLYLSTLP